MAILIENSFADQNSRKKPEQRLRYRHENMRCLRRHPVGISLNDDASAMEDDHPDAAKPSSAPCLNLRPRAKAAPGGELLIKGVDLGLEVVLILGWAILRWPP